MIVDILYFRLHEFIPSRVQSQKQFMHYNFERWEKCIYWSEYGPTLWLSSGMIV